jgi:hypothetical protein
MADIDVTFTDDIPKIEREGFTRKSKYAPILDACIERPGKAAKMIVETQGQASSRASSIKSAAENHDNVTSGEGHFVVATRSGDEEDEYNVFVKYVEGPEPSEDEDDSDEKPKAKAPAKKKATKKRAKAKAS